MKNLEKLDNFNRSTIIILGLIEIAALAVIDYLTGFEISFSFFYLIPVAMVAWYVDKIPSIVLAVISAAMWQFVNSGAGEKFSSEWIPFWNALTRFGFFVVVAILLIKVKTSIKHESSLARTDYLTGAANPRSFYETAQIEIDRSKRYKRSFTVCYFDADNFKQINDTLGHHVGSDLLIRIVQIIKQTLRSTDIIARVGGDEFAILLPETNQEQSRIVIGKIRNELQKEMDKENWNVTFSMGVLTCLKVPHTVDNLIKIADSLMYEVKKTGKDSVLFRELKN